MSKQLRSDVYEGGLTVDPTAGAGVSAAMGTLLVRRGTTELWQKIGPADTDWTLYGGSTAVVVGGWYGSGIDGAHVVAGTETMARVMEWTTLVVPNGTILDTNGWHFFANISVEVQAGGTIRCNGANSASSAAGSGGGAAVRPYQQGANGASSPNGAGATGGSMGEQPKPLPTSGPTSGKGGAGGAGAGGAGGGAGGITNTVLRWSPLPMPWCILGGFPINATTLFGISSGGGSGAGNGAATGGGGGGGGGGVGFASPLVTNNGAIEARGGNGFSPANANTGGGGGGGGGKVFIASRQFVGTMPDVSGGIGGIGNGTGGNGANGSTGYVQVMTSV